METHEFRAETKQLLELMIHSIYSNKDIFLRELISNASDAIDKLRFEALTREDFANLVADPHIRIETDAEARTLTVHDSGIGMSRDEVVEYIGTIARSGTREFVKLLQDRQGEAIPPELIGQFGVGLYASFMVADRIEMLTRRAGEDTATRWTSSGDGTYTLEQAQRPYVGTSITLHLKDPDEDDGMRDYTREWVIREIVRKYSDYVAYPIRMEVQRTEPEFDEEGKPREGTERTVRRDETLNTMKAIWLRPAEEVKDEDYNEFYKHISHDWTDPLERITVRAEGTTEFRGLLFLPARAPWDLFHREGSHGIHLYIRRVFIMNDCKELIPEYLRFVRGVVDSEDLSLNISREILQRNRQIQIIRKRLTSKVLDTLKDMSRKDEQKYLAFWTEFGRVIKEGLFGDPENRDRIFDVALFASTDSPDRLTRLEDYVARMKDDQQAIYYMTGPARAAIEHSPHLEAFRDKGIEVLLLTEPVDEVWAQAVQEYRDKPLRSVGKGTVELGSEDERKAAEEARKTQEADLRPLLDHLRGLLDEYVKEVRLSARLTSSPVCLVGEATDLSPQMEELLRATGQELPRTKRILEVNPQHPILVKLHERFELDAKDPALADFAELLYGQALLAEGNPPPDPGKFSKTMAEVLARAL